MLLAKSAILVHLQAFGVVLLVFHRVVVALFALRAGKCDLHSHNGTSIFNEPPSLYGDFSHADVQKLYKKIDPIKRY